MIFDIYECYTYVISIKTNKQPLPAKKKKTKTLWDQLQLFKSAEWTSNTHIDKCSYDVAQRTKTCWSTQQWTLPVATLFREETGGRVSLGGSGARKSRPLGLAFPTGRAGGGGINGVGCFWPSAAAASPRFKMEES